MDAAGLDVGYADVDCVGGDDDDGGGGGGGGEDDCIATTSQLYENRRLTIRT